MSTTLEWNQPSSSQSEDEKPVLEVIDLHVTYYTDAGRAKALDSVSLSLNAGEKLGLVGESGAGKSTMALAMMNMIKPPGRIESGPGDRGRHRPHGALREGDAQGTPEQDRLYSARGHELA